MGLEKIGLSLAPKTANWLNVSGKTRVLQSKALGKVNVQDLKYVPLKHNTNQSPQTIAKHKVPRYLYHLTSRENYQKILESGYIKPGNDHFPFGVYMLELDSFSKYWGKSMRNDLVRKCGGSNELVMLKIPTSSIDTSKIRLRTQNDVEGKLGSEIEEWFNFTRMPDERKNLLTKLIKDYGEKEAIKRYLDYLPKKYEHLVKGIEGRFTNLYKQRKSDLEFIYDAEIPISNVEYIGGFNYKKEFGNGLQYSFEKLYDENLAKSVFGKLLQTKPEGNCMKAWRD